MIYDPLAIEYNRGYNAAMEKQLHYIDREERRFTAAVAVLQGLVTGKQTMPVLDEDIAAEQAIQAYYAVLQADALLKELAK
jgi:hypothetical protein